MFLALEVGDGRDLTQFSRLLWQRKVSHHIGLQDERQLVLVAESGQVALAKELFHQWQQGEVLPAAEDSSSIGGYVQAGTLWTSFSRAFGSSPLTLILIVTCVVLWLLAPLERPTSLTLTLMFPDFSRGTGTIVLSRVLESFTFGQLLTMLTPALLHGGILHLVFNMSWVWELGRRIEIRQNTLTLAVAMVVIALFSNTIQYLWGGGNNFGGMSGVVYGLFAYIWMWQLFDPRKGLRLPASLIIFMIGMLVLFTWLELDMIANAAHLGGFLSGMVYGAILATISRIRRAVVPGAPR
jgi:GlpG protein